MTETIEQLADKIANSMGDKLRHKLEENHVNPDTINTTTPAIEDGIKRAVVEAAKDPKFANMPDEKRTQAVETIVNKNEGGKYKEALEAKETLSNSKGWLFASIVRGKLDEGAHKGLTSEFQSLRENGKLNAALEPAKPSPVLVAEAPAAKPPAQEPNVPSPQVTATGTDQLSAAVSGVIKQVHKVEEQLSKNMEDALKQFGLSKEAIANASTLMANAVSGINGVLESVAANTKPLANAPKELNMLAENIKTNSGGSKAI